MISVEMLPCPNCVYYGKIRQPDGTEKSEYIYCKKVQGDAERNIYLSNGVPKCDKFKQEGDYGS